MTLGCRVNQYESDAVSEALQKRGFELVAPETPADVCIINTCTVTAESDRKSRQLIRRAANTSAHVIVTGCFSENNRAAALEIPGVSCVISNRDKADIANVAYCLVSGAAPHAQAINTDPYRIFDLKISRSRRARAYIKIEDGCENKCAYCAIPRARGKITSRPIDDVLAEGKRLTESGCRELILTGIECAAYGRDLPEGEDLASLILKLDALPLVSRIGLGSLEPSFLRKDFLENIRNATHLLPHFHISLQSGSSSVLRRMRRKYTAEVADSILCNIRENFPHAMLSADIIVGFPGETETEFAETVEFCRKHRFLHLHVFPYSPRESTEAASMPDQVAGDIKNRRSELLISEGNKIRDELLAEYISVHSVEPAFINVEEIKGEYILGHTEHFVNAAVPVSSVDMLPSPGDILPVYTKENADGLVISYFSRK